MEDWREIDPQFDDPDNYDIESSFYNSGRYPPDWNRRCRAIWQQQSSRCGRCRRSQEEVYQTNVHHIQPLSKGGLNTLDNLVGLCCDCHALIHPHKEGIEGVYFEAPLFPADTAIPQVATVRSKRADGEIPSEVERDLETLEQYSSPQSNSEALNSYTFDIEAKHAKKLPEQLVDILRQNDVIAESSDYYEIELRIKLRGVQAVITDYTPELDIQSDATLIKHDDWTGRWRTLTRRLTLSEDATEVTIELTDETGTTRDVISLDSEIESVELSAYVPLFDIF
jgi:hypothetical protein